MDEYREAYGPSGIQSQLGSNRASNVGSRASLKFVEKNTSDDRELNSIQRHADELIGSQRSSIYRNSVAPKCDNGEGMTPLTAAMIEETAKSLAFQ